MSLEKLIKTTKLASLLSASALTANGSAFESHSTSYVDTSFGISSISDSSENLIGFYGYHNSDLFLDVIITDGSGSTVLFSYHGSPSVNLEDLSVSNSSAIWLEEERLNDTQRIKYWDGSSLQTFDLGTDEEQLNPDIEIFVRALGVSDNGYFYGYEKENFVDDTEQSFIVASIDGNKIFEELDYLGYDGAMVNDKVYFVGSKEDLFNDTISELDKNGIFKTITSTSEDININQMISSGGYLYFTQELQFESPMPDQILLKRYDGLETQNIYVLRQQDFHGIYESDDGVLAIMETGSSFGDGIFHMSDTRGFSKLSNLSTSGAWAKSFYNSSLLGTTSEGFSTESFRLTPIQIPALTVLDKHTDGHYTTIELLLSDLQQGKYYQVLSSADLKNWVEEDSFWNDSGRLTDRETYSSTDKKRFYKLNAENYEIAPLGGIVVMEP